MNAENEISVQKFFLFAAGFELCLGVLGWFVAYWSSDQVAPFFFYYDRTDLLKTAMAAIPLALLAFAATTDFRKRVGFLNEIYQHIEKGLGPLISRLSVSEVIFLGVAAGVGEELLFRGAIQASFGLLGASVLFGLLHSVSKTYALFAFALGLYLGWLYQWTGNLMVPVLLHAGYDILALLLFRGALLRTERSRTDKLDIIA